MIFLYSDMLLSNPDWRDHTTTRQSPQAWKRILTWLIIVLVVAMIVGPVMYLVPSAKDKRLTALRAAARQAGLTVQLTNVAKLDPADSERVSAGGTHKRPTVACTAYQLPVTRRLVGFESLMLIKMPPQPTVTTTEVLDGWSLDASTSRHAWTGYAANRENTSLLAQAIADLPGDALAVGLDKRFVACFWLEKADPHGEAVATIHRVLVELRDDLYRRFAQARDD
jgi:hypothetical protein